MSESLYEFLGRLNSSETAQALGSPLSATALEVLESALWLAAGGRASQALSLAHNSIELALKGELEGIHRVLIADSRQLDYKSLKSLLKESFLQHRAGRHLDIVEFDIEKTITFSECIKRVLDLYPDLQVWQPALHRIQISRNDIVHQGGDPRRISEYTALLYCDAIPFLKHFYSAAHDFSLADLIGPLVNKQLEIAEIVCKTRIKKGRTCVGMGKTVRSAILHRDVQFPLPVDADDNVEYHSAYAVATEQSVRSKLAARVGGWVMQIECKVCGSFRAFASIANLDHDDPTESVPSAIACAECGVEVAPEDEPLAEQLIGPISEAAIRKSLEDFYGPE
jgi:hypothetical protein